MRPGRALLPLVVLALLLSAAGAAEPLFFAFDNGVARGAASPVQQAAWLTEAGYGGISYNGFEHLAERQRACDAAGLVITGLYVGERLDRMRLDPATRDAALALLKGRATVLWLTLQGESTDATIDEVVRETAAAAAKQGVTVVLYPHYGFRIATAEQALAVVERLALPNLGLTFNLCHELRAGNEARFPAIIKRCAPHLRMVSINGAEHAGDWPQLIKPLGAGAVDVLGVLRLLRDVGYSGPIGLQCYNVAGDQRENLRQSFATWRTYQQALAVAAPPAP